MSKCSFCQQKAIKKPGDKSFILKENSKWIVFCEPCWEKKNHEYKEQVKAGKEKGQVDVNTYHGEDDQWGTSSTSFLGICSVCDNWAENIYSISNLYNTCSSLECKEKGELKYLIKNKDFNDSEQKTRLEELEKKYSSSQNNNKSQSNKSITNTQERERERERERESKNRFKNQLPTLDYRRSGGFCRNSRISVIFYSKGE